MGRRKQDGSEGEDRGLSNTAIGIMTLLRVERLVYRQEYIKIASVGDGNGGHFDHDERQNDKLSWARLGPELARSSSCPWVSF